MNKEKIITKVTIESGDRRLPQNDDICNVFSSSFMTTLWCHQVIQTPLHCCEIPDINIMQRQIRKINE